MGKDNSPSSSQAAATAMSEEMEEKILANMDQQMGMVSNLWNKWEAADTAPDGSSISGKQNLMAYKGMEMLEGNEDILLKPLPEVNPGLAPAIDTINNAMGTKSAQTAKDSAMMNPYGSARDDAAERSEQFQRASTIAQTKGQMTSDWEVKKDATNKGNLYNYIEAMGGGSGGNELASMAMSGLNSSTGSASTMMNHYQGIYEDEADRAQSGTNAMWSAVGDIGGWFTGKKVG